MNDILKCLVQYWSFLWSSARYRITDSTVSTSFGGDAYLVIASDALKLRFVRDRGQVFMDVQPSWSGKTAEWYSLDLVRRLLTGQRQPSAEVDEAAAVFVRDNLSDIESLFSDKERFASVKGELGKIKKLRAKEMFG